MRTKALILTVSISCLPLFSAKAECGTKLWQSDFEIVALCAADKSCARGKPVVFEIRPDTSCAYQFWTCAPYRFDECDNVEWSFSDGTTVKVTGSARVEHLFQGGASNVSALIWNDVSWTSPWTRFHWLPVDNAAFVAWGADLVLRENDERATAHLLRSGNLATGLQVFVSDDSMVRLDPNRSRSVRIVALSPGQTSAQIDFHPYNDGIFRGDMTRYVTLLPPSLDSTSVVTGDYEVNANMPVYVVEDDPGPAVHIDRVEIAEGDDIAPRTIEIPVTLSEPLPSGLGIVSNDPALEGTTIAAGETRGTLRFTYQPDGSREPDRTIIIPLTKAGPAVTFGGPPQVTVRILDDDVHRLAPSAAAVRVGSPAELTIGRTSPDVHALTAELESSDPSVLAVGPQRVSIPPLQSEIAFRVQALRVGTAFVTARFDDGNVATSQPIRVIDTPRLTRITPSIARHGDIVRIDGVNLSKECRVTFSGFRANKISFSDGFLTVAVPSLPVNVVTTYDITVVCDGGDDRMRDAFQIRPRRRSASQ